jgi:3'-phosphoadenosine 5'-phosphosulfate sulfotransferase (PAPS reductase)/FAD synthetase
MLSFAGEFSYEGIVEFGIAGARHFAMNFVPLNAGRTGRVLPKHLKSLESQSIEIMREVIAEFKRPVMLYSIGKDSSVMLHLALKAFHPARLPFPLLHVDTTWKFREMISFRDETARRLALDLLVYINQDGLSRGISPVASGSSIHTQVMKTHALKQALDLYGFDAAFGGARRDEEQSRAKERIFSFRSRGHVWDPRSQRPNCGICSTPVSGREKPLASSRYRTGPSLMSGTTSSWRIFRWYPSISPNTARSLRVAAPGSWWMTRDCPSMRASSQNRGEFDFERWVAIR